MTKACGENNAKTQCSANGDALFNPSAVGTCPRNSCQAMNVMARGVPYEPRTPSEIALTRVAATQNHRDMTVSTREEARSA